MRKGRDGEEKMVVVENKDENSGPLTSLPVNRLTATDCNVDRSCQNRGYDWPMRETLFDFVGFSKIGSDTTIEPNFYERTASGI